MTTVEAPRVFVDVADPTAVDPFPQALWGTALWGATDHFWGGTLPRWSEVTCRVLSIATTRGRDGALGIFQPGTASIEVLNVDGYATWAPTAGGPEVGGWVRVRAESTPLWVGIIRRIEDGYTPAGSPTATLVAVDPLSRLGNADLFDPAPVGAGETVAARIGRCLDEVSWPAELRALDPGGIPLTATAMSGPCLDVAQRAAVTAGGALYARADGVVAYRDARWLRTAPRSTTVQARVTNVEDDPWPETPPGYLPNLLTQNQATLETDVTGWRAGAGPTIALDPTRADEGTKSLIVTRPSAGGFDVLTDPIKTPVVEGRTYQYMASVRSAPPYAAILYLRFFTAAGAIHSTVTGPSYTPTNPDAWERLSAWAVAPVGAASAAVRVVGSVDATKSAGIDRAGLFAGNTGVWTPPNYVPPGPDPRARHVCATAMAVRGPDLDRVVSVAKAAGVDEGTDPPGDVEVVRVAQDSRSRWGPASWEVGELYTLDTNQLAGIANRALALRALPVPRVDGLDVSPLADASVGEWILAGDPIGDLVSVAWTSPLGWGWSFLCHVHGVSHRIAPAGADHRAGDWSVSLTLDDATFWLSGAGWGSALWGAGRWSAPVARTLDPLEASWA